jgi:hypothetical protein
VRALPALLAIAGCLAACGPSAATRRQQVKNCSAISLDADGIARCLVAQYRWKEQTAQDAGRRRQHELDSLAAWRQDSAWQVDAKRHREELRQCAEQRGDLARCLEDSYAWDEARATAAFDSVWRDAAAQHRREIRACQGRRQERLGSCLVLYYKWDWKHALAIDDSIARAKIRALNRE